MSLSSRNSIQTVVIYIIYTTIPYVKLKGKLKELIQPSYAQYSYKFLVVGRNLIS